MCRYDKAKEESQISYLLDLYSLDADIRAKGQTNAPALIRALLMSPPAAAGSPPAATQGWPWSGAALLERLRSLKKEMTESRQRLPADQVKSGRRGFDAPHELPSIKGSQMTSGLFAYLLCLHPGLSTLHCTKSRA